MNATRKRRIDERNEKFCIVALVLVCVLLHLLIRSFGYVEHRELSIPPTGGADVFEITCNCCESDNDEEQQHSDNDLGGVIVYDDYKIWDNKELRIFVNPMYGYKNIIAPGSYNSYAFVIRNNNNFDVIVDIIFNETNEEDINMQFKLKRQGEYVLGNEGEYKEIAGVKIENVRLPAKSQKEYILDWKWLDSDNDTAIGFDAVALYKLSITVATK